jgi:hypothetical protein
MPMREICSAMRPVPVSILDRSQLQSKENEDSQLKSSQKCLRLVIVQMRNQVKRIF